MVKIAESWQLDIDRGPDCLFVKISPPNYLANRDSDLAERLWSILSKHFTYRLVLEMDDVDRLPSRVIGDLVLLRRRIQAHGGMLRLCGLSEPCVRALEECCLDGELPNYDSRTDAVMAHSSLTR